MKKLFHTCMLFSLIAAIVPFAHADEEAPSYTRFLIPVFSPDIAGAYGSVWHAETWLRYSGSTAALIVPRPYCFGILCTTDGQLEPNFPSVPLQQLALTWPAILVYVESSHADEVTWESRIRDITRAADSAGSEVPVVREDRMTNGPLYLLNVPIDAKFRIALRLYALPESTSSEMEVRYYRQPSPNGPRFDDQLRLLRTDIVTLATHDSFGEFNFYPAYAALGGIESFPETAKEATIWIEIVPHGSNTRAWALLSITNNETQQVTIISPNR